jgi:hypothetical protein
MHPFYERLAWRWHGSDLPYHLLHFTPESLALAGKRAGLSVRKSETQSGVAGIRSSLAAWMRHRFMVPRRILMVPGPIRWGVDAISVRLAQTYDERQQGEAIEVEFQAAS